MASTAPDVLETGVPNLDRILGGGLLRRSLAMIIGAPGTGKTLLAEQIAFHGAAHGIPALYLTGYSETHDKLVAHSHGLDFFTPERIGQQIQFFSLPDLMREGEETTVAAIVAMARAQQALLVVVDGFRSLRGFLDDDRAVAHFLYSLGANLSLLGATTIIVVEGDPAASSRYPELTVCDVIVALHREDWDGQRRRRLEVLKARGAIPLLGAHPFIIDRTGLAIYPRFESIVAATDPAWNRGRAAFGIPDLDAIVGGGPNVGTATLVVGSLGIGKTTLGLHFIAAGVRAHEPTLFLGFLESPARLREKARMFGLDLAVAEATGQLKFLVLSAHDLEADQIAAMLAEEIERRGVRRLVIDSVSELQRAIGLEGRASNFFPALLSYLAGREVTSYLTLDFPLTVSLELALAGTPLSVLSDNLLLLRQVEYGGRLHRVFSVFKMRFSSYETAIYELTIASGQGIRIAGPAPLGEGLLTGVPQLVVRSPMSPGDGPEPAERS